MEKITPTYVMELKGKLASSGITQKEMALMLGISEVQMSKKLKGKASWSFDDVRKTVAILGIDDDPIEIHRIFFSN